MKEIRIIDTTLRDGHQSLWATRMTTAHMLPVLDRMDRSGFEAIDFSGPVQFDVCVRYLKENPWERNRLVREKARNTPLRSGIRSNMCMTFGRVPEDINELWVERLVATGIRVIYAFDGLNDVDNIANSLNLAKKLGAYTIGVVAFTESPVHTDEHFVHTAKALIGRCNVDSIMLKDPGGLLTVDRIRTLVPALKNAIGACPLELHTHCLTGLGPLVCLEGVKLGVDKVHTGIKPLANGAGNPATQTMVRNLRNMGYAVNVDEALVDEVGEHFLRIAEHEGKPVGVPAEYDVFHFEHQIPGGMISNFKSQLAQVGLTHKLDEVLHECAQIVKELAWPLMITPFCQFVGTQAALNVIHGERYRIVPNEVKKYVLGYYGKLFAPIDSAVLDRIVENGSKAIPLVPQPLPPAVPELRKKYPNASDDERLLRYMFSGSEVDDMLAAGPMRTQYSFGTPLVDLMRELVKMPKAGRVFIRKGELQLELSGAPQ